MMSKDNFARTHSSAMQVEHEEYERVRQFVPFAARILNEKFSPEKQYSFLDVSQALEPHADAYITVKSGWCRRVIDLLCREGHLTRERFAPLYTVHQVAKEASDDSHAED